MTLVELLANLRELDDDLAIYSAISPYAGAGTAAVAAREPDDGTVPAEATGMGYLLEVSVAKEVVDVWTHWRPGAIPTPNQMVEAVVHYAVHDAYLPVEPQPTDAASVTLYRPVGPQELRLIEESGWHCFPPRLDEQPIFYPVLTEQYAQTIARDWNVKASGVGYVTRFTVSSDYLRQHEIHEAGSRDLREYWIPAEDLDQFNDAIVGEIEVISEWRAEPEA
jgi:hypothetical protein